MPKRAIGIDLGSDHLHAVQIVRQGDQLHIERVFTAPARRSTDNVSGLLRDLSARHGFDWRLDCGVAMPPTAVFYADVGSDPGTIDSLRRGESAACADRFPLPADQVVAAICTDPDPADGTLAAAASRDALEMCLAPYSEARLSVSLVDAEIFAIQALVLANHPEFAATDFLLAYVTASHLTLGVVRQGRIRLVRSTTLGLATKRVRDNFQVEASRVLCREATITWPKACARSLDKSSQVVLVADRPFTDDLRDWVEQGLGCPTTWAQVGHRISMESGPDQPSPSALATGLAIRAIMPNQTQGPNFLGTGARSGRTGLNLRKELSVCAALAGAIGGVWLIGLLVQVSYLESRYAALKTRVQEVFHQTVPEEKALVNPVAQVRQRLAAYSEEGRFLGGSDGPTPLQLLEILTEARPEQVAVQDLVINSQTVTLKAVAGSFDAIYQWQRDLQAHPAFDKVEVQDPIRDPATSQVRARMILSVRPGANHDPSET